MRGTKAKRLRKETYGEDYSPRLRSYVMDNHGTKNIGIRAKYKKAKRNEQ
jgi:hypothetical protein